MGVGVCVEGCVGAWLGRYGDVGVWEGRYGSRCVWRGAGWWWNGVRVEEKKKRNSCRFLYYERAASRTKERRWTENLARDSFINLNSLLHWGRGMIERERYGTTEPRVTSPTVQQQQL